MALKNTIKIGTGTKDVASGAGTATQLNTSDEIYRVIIFCNDSNNTSSIFIGDSNVDATDAAERGIEIQKGTTLTIDATDMMNRGVHGIGQQKYINLKDLYIDGLTNGDTLTWFGYS